MSFPRWLRQWVSHVAQQPRGGDPALFDQAAAYSREGRMAEAEACYRDLLARHPDDFDLLLMLGINLGQRGQFAPAMEFLERALRADSRSAAAYSAMGNCLRGLQRHTEALNHYDKALALHPDDADAWFNRGATYRDVGNIDQALTDFKNAITHFPDHLMAHEALGRLHLALENPAAAADSFRHVLRLASGNVDALLNLGTALVALGRHAEALACFDQVLAGDSTHAGALANRAQSLSALKRHEEALASLDEALRIVPDHETMLVNRGVFLLELARCDEALEMFDKALLGTPDSLSAHYNRALTLDRLQRHDEAVHSFDRALALAPDHVDSMAGRAIALRASGRRDEALAALDRALTLRADQFDFHLLRSRLLGELRRPAEALTSIDHALALRPDDANAHFERAGLLTLLMRVKDAIASYGNVLALEPEHAQALFHRGYLQIHERQGEAAAEDWLRLSQIAPDYPFIQGYLLRARLYSCDWHDIDGLLTGIRDAIEQGKTAVEPLIAAGALTEPALLKRCAEIYVQHHLPAVGARPPAVIKRQGQRLRVGYMAGEFRRHAITYLTSEVYERHDRQQFEIIALDSGYDDGSPSRARIERAFDEVIPITPLNDAEAVATIRRLGIDILVDLSGHTGMRRTAVLSQRPAPVQVNWLGFPGTMGAPFMDYIIADPVIIPPEHERHYTEKIVRLPDTYQPTDSLREIPVNTPTRAEANLPDDGFVFCCFNDHHKILPEVFDVWMRVLSRVPGSVLWLLQISDASARGLRVEAMMRGVAPERLVFAPLRPMPEHLARHRLADLFLDTLPYNAHTTASDALWAGLPLLTCIGSAFAGRVAASLLRAAGLPELVTYNRDDYETMAVRLASSPELLARLRAKLAGNRSTCALFDVRRYTRHIESAYITMHERAVRGEPLAGFDVAPLPAG